MKKINRLIIFLRTFFYIVLAALIMTIYINYRKQKKIILQSHLDMEMNFIRETARISKIWFDKRLKEKNSTIDAIEQEIFVNFIDPIHIFKNGDAWIYNRNHVIFDKSSDFPKEYQGKSIREIFNMQKNKGAYHYDNIVKAVEEAGEGTGYYVWLPDKGKEWAAWTSFGIAGQTWTLGLSTPENEILEYYNMSSFWAKQIIYSILVIAMLIALFLYIIAYQKEQGILISELDNANNELKELHRLRSDFVVNISHDFRVPLTIISNLTELNLMKHKDLPPEVFKDFKAINNTSMKFLSKINMLLGIARIQSSGLRLKIIKVNLPDFIDEIVLYYRSLLKHTGIKIETLFPEKKIEFYSDIEMIEDIVNNLVSNAVKFVDINTGRIFIELDETDSSAVIRIKDNGVGIEENELMRIFDRFKQGKSAYEIKYQGSGIGLSYSRQLAEILGGSIEAESPGRNRGAVFTVSLSREKFAERDIDASMGERKIRYKKILLDLQPDNSAEETVSLKNTNRQNEFNSMKGIILVADDDRRVRDIIKRYLSNEGYSNFLLAQDGKRALELFNKYHPDLVITDFFMPGMNGFEFHEAVISNTDYSFIPFIFISSVADENLVLNSKKMGVSDFLFKPIVREELVAAVNTNMKKYINFLRMTAVDELSKFANRSFFLKTFDNILLEGGDSDVSLIMFDLDHFKTINDSYGHQAGDYVISSVCSLVLAMIRNKDIAGRYGGEEFGIILPGTGAAQAGSVADKIRKSIESLDLDYEGIPIKITASFGVSSLAQYNGKKNIDQEDASPSEEIIRMADQAMYAAKSAKCPSCAFTAERNEDYTANCPHCGHNMTLGRNRVEIHKQNI